MTAGKTLVAAAFPLLAALAASAAGAQPPQRQTHVTVYGDEPCPEPEDPEEIVVCAQHPEDDRYRVPERRGNQRRPAETAWGARAMDLEEAQRWTRPNGCSPVGMNGQSGCMAEMIRNWYAERRERRRGN